MEKQKIVLIYGQTKDIKIDTDFIEACNLTKEEISKGFLDRRKDPVIISAIKSGNFKTNLEVEEISVCENEDIFIEENYDAYNDCYEESVCYRPALQLSKLVGTPEEIKTYIESIAGGVIVIR